MRDYVVISERPPGIMMAGGHQQRTGIRRELDIANDFTTQSRVAGAPDSFVGGSEQGQPPALARIQPLPPFRLFPPNRIEIRLGRGVPIDQAVES